jgi:hypothetical protein
VGQALDFPFRDPADALLRRVGRGPRRLRLLGLELKHQGQLIHHWARDETTGRHILELNPKIAALYGRGGWSRIEWSQRQLLKGQPLAQWLHGFYTTHTEPFPYRVDTLHELCGSEIQMMKHFRAELREALAKIAAATGWAWEIDAADLVHIHRTPSATG